MHNSFKNANPIVCFSFFMTAVLFGVLFFHPVMLTVSLLSALLYAVYLKGAKAFVQFFGLCLPVTVISALINSLFCHYGVTVLFILPDGNNFTAEALLYGVFTGVMLSGVIMWFSCYNEIFTTDKFLYVFGKILPSFSLVISMALRFIPRYRVQAERISQAQRGIHSGITDGNAAERAKHGISVISVLTTWALENGVETSDSMRARGYGLKGRTSFSLYKFDANSVFMLAAMAVAAGLTITGASLGAVYASFNPRVNIGFDNPALPFTVAFYALFCLFPLICDTVSEAVWKIRINKNTQVSKDNV